MTDAMGRRYCGDCIAFPSVSGLHVRAEVLEVVAFSVCVEVRAGAGVRFNCCHERQARL